MKLGIEGKSYFCVAGIGGAPVWTEMTTASNVTLNVANGEVEQSDRSSLFKLIGYGMVEASIDLDMDWDTTDPACEALLAAATGRTAIGIACMDGDVATPGSQGLWADMAVLAFPREEPMGDSPMSVKFSLKPMRTANPPEWKTVA